jgi:4-hydroxy-tetrahydrodipicolinate synthase
MRETFRGTWVALVTPFSGGRVDEPALRRLVRRVVDGGVDGLVPCGCTGEAGFLDLEEQARVIRVTLEEAAGSVPVVAGTGTHYTRTTLECTRQAASLGVRAAMVITPYYVKPTQEGLYQHYRLVVEEGGLPVMLYNVPGRTGVSLAPETVARLAELPGVVAIKEASGSPDQVSRIRALCDLPVLSGDDGLTLSLMAVGACGVVSVAADVWPRPVVEMVNDFAAGKVESARRTHARLAPLVRALFMETNPAPAKAALALLGVIGPEMRLPLVPVRVETVKELVRVLREGGESPAEALRRG